MNGITSGGFSTRDSYTQRLIAALNECVLSPDRYFRIDTGIEHRFGDKAKEIHNRLYYSLGPTTDLLRYFPDCLYFDLKMFYPDWEANLDKPREYAENENQLVGNFTFFAEYKYSGTPRKKPLPNCPNVPLEFIGIIEREAWLTYRRITNPNPDVGTYLDGSRPRIAMFYVATYAPELLYAGWEEWIEPINIVDKVARPGKRALITRGSGTPWINFDIRVLKPIEAFLVDDLYWGSDEAIIASQKCRDLLFG